MGISLRLVPDSPLGWELVADELAENLRGSKVALLTGAGISTESGIPDYRGEETRRRARNPIRFDEFIASEGGRKRYWARSTLGWPAFRDKAPNSAHETVAKLEDQGLIRGVITQNVDRLHQKAGSRNVIELHGALAEVHCLSCGELEARDALQERLLKKNPHFLEKHAELAPDGDAELTREEVDSFEPVHCQKCGGALKPSVVFFGETVAKDRVEKAMSLVQEADALLVVGSSLAVFSGFRFPRRAHELGKEIYIVNVGPTRADPLATLKVEGIAGDVLTRVSHQFLEKK